MDTTQMRMVYVTTPSKSEAVRIGRHLIEKRLAACVNILDNMTSIYHWQGNIEEDQEAVMIAKTSEEFVRPLTDEIVKIHGYDVPCVVTLPIVAGNEAYLSWLQECLTK